MSESRSVSEAAKGSSDSVPGSAAYRRDLAFWKETLRSAPQLARIRGRRRAPAPAGMGRNRGAMGFVTATLHDPVLASRARLGTELMTAFVRTLRAQYALDAIVVDRWFTERGSIASDDRLGPLDSFYPIILPDLAKSDDKLTRLIERFDALGYRHRGLDTPALVRILAEELRKAGTFLRQFGFAFLDAAHMPVFAMLETPLEAVTETPHEIQLAAAVSGSELQLRLAVDLDVVDQAGADALFERLIRELGDQIGATAALRPVSIAWSTRLWPELQQGADAATDSAQPSTIANAEREIPVTSTQSALLYFQEHPDATPHARSAFSGSKAWIVRPSMDMARLNRAVEMIRARHEVMRLRFVRSDGGYRAYLEEQPSEILFIEEASDEAAAVERATALSQEWIGIDEPMFRVTLIRFGAGDLIFAMGHHLVTDGYSIGLFLEETISAYLGLPLPELQMDIDRFIREYDHVGKDGSFAARDAFLRQVFADPPPVPRIGRKAKGLRPNVDLVDCGAGMEASRMLSREQEGLINANARAAGASPTAMMIAAFAQTLGARGGVDDLIIQVPAALRHSYRLENYANFVASDVPVRVRLAGAPGLAQLAASISASISAAMEFAPFMDSNYFGDLHDELVANGSYTSLFVAGDRTVERWMRQTASAALQDVFATDQIDLGMFKVRPLPDLRQSRPAISELDLRRFSVGAGLRLTLEYDTQGYSEAEAYDILDDIAGRLLLPA